MRASWTRVQVAQKMDLRSENERQEQQADQTAICAVYSHVLGKTQLRGESLRGQEADCGKGCRFRNKQPGARLTVPIRFKSM